MKIQPSTAGGGSAFLGPGCEQRKVGSSRSPSRKAGKTTAVPPDRQLRSEKSPAIADALCLGSRCDVPFFAVLVNIEPLSLDLGRDAQTDRSPDERADDGASYNCQDNRDRDGL
jgi:hypothetical protein